MSSLNGFSAKVVIYANLMNNRFTLKPPNWSNLKIMSVFTMKKKLTTQLRLKILKMKIQILIILTSMKNKFS